MGGSASCLNNPERCSKCSLRKKGKTRSRIIKVGPHKPAQGQKVCQYCHCQNEECRLRTNGDLQSSAERVRTVKCGTGNESIYVGNTQFPFRRPKTLPVKPFVDTGEKSSIQSDQDGRLGGDFAPKQIYGFYPYQNLQRLTISEPTAYLHGQPPQHTYEDLKRSASYNPSVTRPMGNVLPHRTVERLKSTESYQFFHDTYPPEIFTRHILEARSTKRPPTPWFPPARTNDYLVASSMLAAEQERERHGSRL